MSDITKPPPSYAPVYAAALYPEMAAIAREHGYALAVHGSLQRDFDLIAVPWVEEGVSPPQALVDAIVGRFHPARQIGEGNTVKPHGRRAWTISIGHGNCACDLSFMPAHRPHLFTGGVMSVCVLCAAFEGQPSARELCDPSKLAGKTESCCECGTEYPRSELLMGHIYCPTCRANHPNQGI